MTARPEPPLRRPMRTRWIRWTIIAAGLAWALAPLLFLLLTSLKPANAFLEIPPRLLPSSVTLDNFRTAFNDFDAWRVAVNSLTVTTAVIGLSLLFGIPGGYALHRLSISPRVVIFFVGVLLFVRFYPRIATIVPWFLAMRELDLLDTRLAVILGHLGLTLPLATWLMHTTFRQVPPDFDEAAIVDGAGLWQRLVRVQIPLAAPGIAAAAILSAFLSWNEFLVAASTTREGAKVLSVTVAAFITDKGVLWGPMAAIAALIIIPPLVFALFAQRNLIRGLTGGGVKG